MFCDLLFYLVVFCESCFLEVDEECEFFWVMNFFKYCVNVMRLRLDLSVLDVVVLELVEVDFLLV